MSVKSDIEVLEQLEDKQALRDLNAKYCRAADRGDEGLLASLWSRGAQVDHGGFAGPASEFVRVVTAPDATRERTFHSISNEYFEIDGAKARGEIYVISVSTHDRGGKKTDELIGGRYLDEYEKSGGKWAIARRTFVHEWNMNFPTSAVWDEGLFGMIKLRGTRTKADPIYTLFGAQS